MSTVLNAQEWSSETTEVSPEWLERNFPCMKACPVQTEAGRYVHLIAQGRYEEAYRIARAPNPFASICGRICAAPCEKACRRGELDQPIAIRALKRFVCERFGVESFVNLEKLQASLRESIKPKDKWVAIVGAGPAGLSCAHDLALLGYRVTLFEAQEVPGGMLRLGIPEYRLPRELIRLEVNLILSLGVELKLGKALGRDFTLQDLLDNGFDAVFLAIGAHQSRTLDIDGAAGDGVLNAVDFLLNANLGYKVELGDKITVIGGGSVAFDVARTAARLERAEPVSASDITAALDVARSAVRFGAKQVDMVVLESQEEMPVEPEEITQAQEERIHIHNRSGPKRILTKHGRVVGLETIRVASVFGEGGRFEPRFIPGTEEAIEADTIIVAIGQTSDLSWVSPKDGLETNPQGTIKVQAETLATSIPGIFAGGDLAFGPRLAINAVADGRRAAREVDSYLSGSSHREPEYTITRYDTATFRPIRGYTQISRQEIPALPLARRVGIAQVELGYQEEEAVREASRCLQCWVNTIFEGDPNLGTECILCGGCADVCPENCIEILPVARMASTVDDALSIAHGLNSHHARTHGRGLVLIKDESICIRCGLCARRCPAGTISMQGFQQSETRI
jgi:NADPH-dependent glutamate synthase beta subunit-like oxidoreductase/NAD-dependent dihydropyrimidine dehydrogenase PreA subunit